MKVQDYSPQGEVERLLLGELVHDGPVLARLSFVWPARPPGLFNSPEVNTVAQWCVSYFRKHAQAPGQVIGKIFAHKMTDNRDEAKADLLERLIVAANEEHKHGGRNSEYSIDMLGKHLNEVALRRLADDISAALDAGRPEDADKLRAEFKPISLGLGQGYDAFRNSGVIESMFSEDQLEPVALYEEPALAEFYRNALCRDSFVSITGADKSGKSYVLLDMVFRALKAGKRVAYFEAGDLSERDIMFRIAIRQARQPDEACDILWPTAIKAPTAPGEPADVEWDTLSRPALTKADVTRAFALFNKDPNGDDGMKLHLSVHPNSTLSAAGIRTQVDQLAQSGWVPDMVAVDYSDILAPPPGMRFDQGRDAIDATWRQLRAISQEFHCLLATPTQCDTEGYQAKVLSRRNFSGDKRKNAHVTAAVGINMTAEEKKRGVMRLNWIVRRKGMFESTRCLHVAGCLALANPCVKATF